jgi:hypothetical protein
MAFAAGVNTLSFQRIIRQQTRKGICEDMTTSRQQKQRQQKAGGFRAVCHSALVFLVGPFVNLSAPLR